MLPPVLSLFHLCPLAFTDSLPMQPIFHALIATYSDRHSDPSRFLLIPPSGALKYMCGFQPGWIISTICSASLIMQGEYDDSPIPSPEVLHLLGTRTSFCILYYLVEILLHHCTLRFHLICSSSYLHYIHGPAKFLVIYGMASDG